MSTTGARVNDWLHPVMGVVVTHAPITPTNNATKADAVSSGESGEAHTVTASSGTKYNAPIAQLVEQRTFNPVVTGSNPVGCTN